MEEQSILRVPPFIAERVECLLNEDPSSSEDKSSDLSFSEDRRSGTFASGRNHHQQQQDPMQSWWESVSKARTRIQTLLSLLPSFSESLSSLPDSDRPARSLLESFAAYSAMASSLSGSGDDPLCHWLYDSFQLHTDSDDLRLVVLSFVPLVAGLYLSRVHAFSTTVPNPPSPSLAGFEAVLLALYSSETKSRAGKPLLVSIPDPAYLNHHPSLYHHPHPHPPSTTTVPSSKLTKPFSSTVAGSGAVSVGIMCPPLEPQVGIKSTKRASIVGVAFHSFYQHISHMPPWSKLDLCRFAASWAGQDCPCPFSLGGSRIDDEDVVVNDDDVVSSPSFSSRSPPTNGVSMMMIEHLQQPQPQPHPEILASQEMGRMNINAIFGNTHQIIVHGDGDAQVVEEEGPRIPLPWDLLRPLLRILAHCLLAPLNSQDIRDAASLALRRLYARASHDLAPQAIIATRSLVQLDNRARAAAKAAALANASSNATTPRPPKKPEVLLASK